MPCIRKALKKALRPELPANVVPIRRDPEIEDVRAALLNAGVEYCERVCNGCSMTRALRKRCASKNKPPG